ncbi:MAG: DUF2384 domain-containing protein [Proteobacteria bacterium]|nr:DUF2384 domain-containing protein [Pseudomonadota bacterium]
MRTKPVSHAADPETDQGRVVSAAIVRIADYWKLTNEQLGGVLGLSPASASRLRTGSYRLKPGDKAFELGQYLVRLFRGLDAIMGSDDEATNSWLRAPNLDLGGRPIDRIATIRGLMDVADYVDDFRAQV